MVIMAFAYLTKCDSKHRKFCAMILAWMTFTGKRYYQRPGYVQRNKTLSPARCDWLVNEITWRIEALRGTEYAVRDEYALFWVVRQSCNPSKTSTAMPTTTSAPMVTRTYVRGTCIQRRKGKCLNWLKDVSVSFNWLQTASRFVDSFSTESPNTCRFAGTQYRCTLPLNGQFATLVRLMSSVNVEPGIAMIDRGPYGVHLDMRLSRDSVLTLIEALQMNTPGMLADMIDGRIRRIEESITVELGESKPPYSVHHVDPREAIRGIMENVATEDIYYATELYPSRRRPISHARLLGNITNIFTAGSNLSDSSSFEGNRMTKVIERSRVRAQERYETLQDDVYTSTDPVHEG